MAGEGPIATKPSTPREQAHVLRVWGVRVLGLEVELAGVDLGLGLGWWYGDLTGVGKGGGVRGRPGGGGPAEVVARAGGAVAPPAAGGGGGS
jgi:hypothetical protein